MSRHGSPSQMRAKAMLHAALPAARTAIYAETKVPGAFVVYLPLSDGRVQPVVFPGVAS